MESLPNSTQMELFPAHHLGTRNINNMHHLSVNKRQSHRRSASHVPRSMTSHELYDSTQMLVDYSQMQRSVSNISDTPMTGLSPPDSSSQSSSKPKFRQLRAFPSPLNTELIEDNPSTASLITPSRQNLNGFSFPTLNSSPHSSTPQRFEDPADFVNRLNEQSISPYLNQCLDANMLATSSPPASTPVIASISSGTETRATSSQESCNYNFVDRDTMTRDGLDSHAYASHVNQTFQYPLFPSQEIPITYFPENCRFKSVSQAQAQYSCSGDMKRSLSSGSSSSNSSTRSIKRLQEQNNLAVSQPLMPKGIGKRVMAHGKTSLVTRSRKELEKINTSKSTYQRPKHERVYCRQCESHPEGFRGEHELRRHQDREHKKLVRRFICVQPQDGRSHPEPVFPLSECKACYQQKKKYNAYYNAAAHLRRAHFMPKVKGRSKNKRQESDKRGGKGGGDWPSMTELKFWMRDVQETAAEISRGVRADDDASNEEPKNNQEKEPHYLPPAPSPFKIVDQSISDEFQTSPAPVPLLSTPNVSNGGSTDVPLDILKAPNSCIDNLYDITTPFSQDLSSLLMPPYIMDPFLMYENANSMSIPGYSGHMLYTPEFLQFSSGS
ncbi:BgTH12-02972 [Blumeria graminis f. sp. triticale]|uniref:BgTH12-02972 n=1 Tax=Blumeria graminis f. sp. triticale TaxID=1689686 RepID=A0A9W4D279_BLUGR|nr:BgTH12-02972 [Blumeria graminis f. sp. triticale]